MEQADEPATYTQLLQAASVFILLKYRWLDADSLLNINSYNTRCSLVCEHTFWYHLFLTLARFWYQRSSYRWIYVLLLGYKNLFHPFVHKNLFSFGDFLNVKWWKRILCQQSLCLCNPYKTPLDQHKCTVVKLKPKQFFFWNADILQIQSSFIWKQCCSLLWLEIRC